MNKYLILYCLSQRVTGSEEGMTPSVAFITIDSGDMGKQEFYCWKLFIIMHLVCTSDTIFNHIDTYLCLLS